MNPQTEAQTAYWKERWDRKTRQDALEWQAFKDFIQQTPNARLLARPKSTYAKHYRALTAAHEVFIARIRKATRREKANVLTHRWAAFLQTLLRRCESGVVLPAPVEQQSSRARKEAQAGPLSATTERSPHPKTTTKKSGPRRGEVGHKDRTIAVEPGWVEVQASKFVGRPPELVFTPDKKRSKVRPGETVDIFNATMWRITAVPELGRTPHWYNEYWGDVVLGDRREKYTDIIDRIREGESCDDECHSAIRAVWAEVAAGMLAQLRGEPCTGTSEAWHAGHHADVDGLSADHWDEHEGRFTEEEAAS